MGHIIAFKNEYISGTYSSKECLGRDCHVSLTDSLSFSSNFFLKLREFTKKLSVHIFFLIICL